MLNNSIEKKLQVGTALNALNLTLQKLNRKCWNLLVISGALLISLKRVTTKSEPDRFGEKFKRIVEHFSIVWREIFFSFEKQI